MNYKCKGKTAGFLRYLCFLQGYRGIYLLVKSVGMQTKIKIISL